MTRATLAGGPCNGESWTVRDPAPRVILRAVHRTEETELVYGLADDAPLLPDIQTHGYVRTEDAEDGTAVYRYQRTIRERATFGSG